MSSGSLFGYLFYYYILRNDEIQNDFTEMSKVEEKDLKI